MGRTGSVCRVVTAVALLGLLASGGVAGEVVIDGFEAGPIYLFVKPANGAASASQTPTSPVPTLILGGTRFVEVSDVTNVLGGSGNNTIIEVVVDVAKDDYLSWQNGTNIISVLELIYGVHQPPASSQPEGSELNVDFSASTAVTLQLVFLDQSVNITLELTSHINEINEQTHRETKTRASPVAAGAPVDVVFDLVDYTAAGVDLADIDKVLVKFQGPVSVDMSISEIRTVAPPPAALGDYVWEDLNADGIQNDGNTGISGVTVNLTGAGPDGVFATADDTTATTVTANDGSGNPGFYQFTGLTPGDYFVEFVNPGGYNLSPQDVGGNTPASDALDSDANPVTGVAAVTTLDPGENDPTWDAGLYKPEEPKITIEKTGVKVCPHDEPPPCGPCEGKITWLDLQYIGEEQDAEVKVYQKKMSSPVFTGTIQPGDTFKVVGQDDKGTLGTEIYVFIGRCLNAKIHTSCSQPIGPGLVKGDFLVVAGESLKGGPLCAVDASGDDDDDCCGKKPKGHGKKPKGHGKKKPKCDDCDDDDDCPEPCDPSVIYVGDTIEYTITITATGLAEERQIVVADRLDSSLEFLEADPEAQWVSDEHKVVWRGSPPRPRATTGRATARAASAPTWFDCRCAFPASPAAARARSPS